MGRQPPEPRTLSALDPRIRTIDVRQLVANYRSATQSQPPETALKELIAALDDQPLRLWLEAAAQLGAAAAAIRLALAEAAARRFPSAPDAHYQVAVALRAQGQTIRAEAELRQILNRFPSHKDAAFNLGGLLRDAGRLHAARFVIDEFSRSLKSDDETMLQCAVFLRQCQGNAQAAAVCEAAIAHGALDPRIYFLAGQLASTLGDFDRARRRLMEALEARMDLNAWQIPQALADLQRYQDDRHPDFALFEHCLKDLKLEGAGRASVLFAQGKACDDIGAYDGAVRSFREANAAIRPTLTWNSANWLRFVDDQLNAPPPRSAIPPPPDFTPVFIVGMPRSGTTLLAAQLERYASVRNRGELNLLPSLWDSLTAQALIDRERALFDASRLYYSHVVQDDAPAKWYIDKNALNFRYLNLIVRLFPNARVLYCRRHSLDTAFSIWSHQFVAGPLDFAYDFKDIAAVDESCQTLMSHWQATLPLAVHTVNYEEMVHSPQASLDAAAAFLGLTGPPAVESATAVVATSSVWQVRQQVYLRSIGRWQAYQPYLPEMVSAFAPRS